MNLWLYMCGMSKKRQTQKIHMYVNNTETAILIFGVLILCDFWFCLFACLYFINF